MVIVGYGTGALWVVCMSNRSGVTQSKIIQHNWPQHVQTACIIPVVYSDDSISTVTEVAGDLAHGRLQPRRPKRGEFVVILHLRRRRRFV